MGWMSWLLGRKPARDMRKPSRRVNPTCCIVCERPLEGDWAYADDIPVCYTCLDGWVTGRWEPGEFRNKYKDKWYEHMEGRWP